MDFLRTLIGEMGQVISKVKEARFEPRTHKSLTDDTSSSDQFTDLSCLKKSCFMAEVMQ